MPGISLGSINVILYEAFTLYYVLQFNSFVFLVQNKKVGDEILDLLNVPSHKVRIDGVL